uniref:Uncharacterized protein n=1 Tax=Salix viminalis TaxID=40686 RepID=A0A6N2KAT5_SALVM
MEVARLDGGVYLGFGEKKEAAGDFNTLLHHASGHLPRNHQPTEPARAAKKDESRAHKNTRVGQSKEAFNKEKEGDKKKWGHQWVPAWHPWDPTWACKQGLGHVVSAALVPARHTGSNLAIFVAQLVSLLSSCYAPRVINEKTIDGKRFPSSMAGKAKSFLFYIWSYPYHDRYAGR